MPSIEFPGITMITPATDTGVAINSSICLAVPLVLLDAGTFTYAYPDIDAMRNSTTHLFTQHAANNNLTGGFGMVRKRLVESTLQEGEAAQGLANYPDDWAVAASFGDKIDSTLTYTVDAATPSTEEAAKASTISELQVCRLLLNPVANFDYNGTPNVLIERTLPYKTIIILP